MAMGIKLQHNIQEQHITVHIIKPARTPKLIHKGNKLAIFCVYLCLSLPLRTLPLDFLPQLGTKINFSSVKPGSTHIV